MPAPAFAHLFLDRPSVRLIVLNACEGASRSAHRALAGVAPWLLRRGLPAVVAMQWPIKNSEAGRFATELYRELTCQGGGDLNAAMARARGALFQEKPYSPAFANAVFYSRAPDARLSIPAAPTVEGSKAARPPRAKGRKELGVHAVPRPAPPPPPDPSPRLEVVEPPRIEPEQPAGPRPGEERINAKDGSVLVFVPGGRLSLGAKEVHEWSRPVHRVCLSPFWIGKFPVTNQQYSRFLEENPAYGKPPFWDDPNFNPPQHPIVGVSWEEAGAYCRWAGLELPTEAQWEAAARGCDQRPYPWGRKPPTPEHANFGGARAGTTPVAAHPAGCGPYGTFDQAGNVWEWCADLWVSKAYQMREETQLDPVARGETAVRALRGGSWMNPAQDLRAAYRGQRTAKRRVNDQGFRCLWRPA